MIKIEYKNKDNAHGAIVEVDGSLGNIKTELYALLKFISNNPEMELAFSAASRQLLKEQENDSHNLSN